MHHDNVELAFGTKKSPQNTFELMELEQKVGIIETGLLDPELLDEPVEIMANRSPIHIPKNATVKKEDKNGYKQVKYTWTRGKYKYIARWHTRTPNAPKEQGNSWVIERHLVGKGFGPDAHPAERHIYIRTNKGKGKWVNKTIWQDAIRAQRQGVATDEQKELLSNGHWKD